jgi:hypothetical protein
VSELVYLVAKVSYLFRDVLGFTRSPGAVGEVLPGCVLEGKVEAAPAGVQGFGRV